MAEATPEQKERMKLYYKKNRKKLLKQFKKYATIHTEELREYQKKYHIKNKVKSNKQSREWYLKNKDNLKEYYKNHYLENLEDIKKYHKQWAKSHRKELNNYSRKYTMVRKKTDIGFKILCNLRNRVYYTLKGNPKISTTMNLVGCSIDQLKQHLEQQFKPGMSWENYGFYGWHIDHKRPCASFDLSVPEHQKLCFHYTNLQPLWAEENMKKGNKLIGEF